MKLLLTISFLIQFACSYGLITVKSVKELRAKSGTDATALGYYTPGDGGGGYYLWLPTTLPDDSGSVIRNPAYKLSAWVAQFDGRVSVKRFGAKGDGVNDDQPAFVRTYKYCSTQFVGNTELYFSPKMIYPDGLYRFLRPFKMGGQPLSAEDALHFEWYNNRADSYSWIEHSYGIAGTLPVSIEAGTRAYLWGDFEADTLTAIVSIGSVGYVYGGYDMQSAKIEGLKIIGKNKMNGRSKNQVGLLFTASDMILENCSFYGLDEGMIDNTSYFNTLINFKFKNCKRGYYSIGSHCTLGLGMTAFDCDKGIEIRSGASTYKQIRGERNITTLIIGDGYNTFDGLYLESHYDGYQLIIGYPTGYDVKGVTISGLTIPSPYGIYMDSTARGVTITGSQFVSAATKMTHPLNVLDVKNSFTDMPKYMPGKIFVEGKLFNPQ